MQHNRYLIVPSPSGRWNVYDTRARTYDPTTGDRYSVVPVRDGRWGLFDRQLNSFVAYGNERQMRNKHMAVLSALRVQSKLEAAE